MSEATRTWKAMLAEFAGTFAVVFAGCGALMLADRFPHAVPALGIPLVFGYWVSQFLGAGAGIALLEVLFPHARRFGATVPTVAWPEAVGWEALLTFGLVAVILVVTTARWGARWAAPAIGVAVGLDALVGGPLTGASMNPARSLAPLLAEGHLPLMGIYLVGPLSGAIAAALLFNYVLAGRRQLVLIPVEPPRD